MDLLIELCSNFNLNLRGPNQIWRRELATIGACLDCGEEFISGAFECNDCFATRCISCVSQHVLKCQRKLPQITYTCKCFCECWLDEDETEETDIDR